MAVSDTNVSDTPDEPGANAADTAGTTTTGAKKPATGGPGAGEPSSERTFTQAEVNAIVQRRLAEQERTLTAKHKEDLDGKLETVRNESLADLEKQVEDRVAKKAAELQLASTRAEIQKARGLTEKQLARLQGATPEELLADAVDVFGELPTTEETEPDAEADKPARKKAPKIGGGGGGQGSGLDITKMSPAEIRKHAKDLWPKR